MATQDYAASITGIAIRVTRLDATGNLLNSAGDSYTTAAFLRVSWTPEYEEGDEITQKKADGSVCISYKSPDTLKRITMELAICEPDPELTNLVAGGLLLRKNLGTFGDPNDKSVGWASPAVGDSPSGNGVSIESWSLAIKDGKKATTLPYFHWVFPYVKLRQSGDRVLENGALANTFEGYGLGNDLFESGPDERWEWPTATDRPYIMARTSWAPSGLMGFYTWHGTLTAAVENMEVSTNVATLTTTTAHGFVVGDSVVVTEVDATLNGTFTVLAAPTTLTFTYSKETADVTSSPVDPVGSATVGAGPRAVTTLPNGSTEEDFNVPGNVDYDADVAIDNVLNSSEDPLA